ncbi:MAG: hypothetical protein KKG06_11670 [Bacteroidetes bacterium]|nr:hypothetical protein [Bacteroidota bacterium]
MDKNTKIFINIILLIGILFIIILIIIFGNTERKPSIIDSPGRQTTERPTISSEGKARSPSDAGFVKGLGRDVIQAELNQWSSIGLITNYEFTGSTVTVYVNHSDWISLPHSTQADFKAGIRSKWPDGSVVFKDSQTGERL